MKKNYWLFFALLVTSFSSSAQHYGMFNTRSMFDGFENPAVKTFVLDSSFKYASNFFFPNFSSVAANRGSAKDVIRRALNEGRFTTSGLPIGDGIPNQIFQTSNVYLFTFKIFNHFKYQQEIGFSWQVRSDAKVNYTNETLAILDTYRRFSNVPYNDIFKTSGYQQTYHQFSVSIRENWDKRLAFGAKLSLLSGIAYNELDIYNSYIYADVANDRLDIGLNGRYKGTFINDDEINRKTLLPTFKSPGASISIGTTYNSPSGYFLMANLKDLGFIRWRKSYEARFDKIESIYGPAAQDIDQKLVDFVNEVNLQKSFFKPTNAKVDFMVSRTFDFYQPSLVASKYLFHAGGDIAFVNRFKLNDFSASLIPAYNFNDFIMFGIQAMYQTPNFEFFLGTDNLGKSISTGRGLSQSDATVGTGYMGASIYMGLGIKFGSVVNHPMNLSSMPGVGGEKNYKGFFRTMFNLFKRKQY